MLRFFKHFAVYGLVSIISKVAAVFLMPLYTNTLTRREYGIMALLMASKGVIDLVSNLNIHSGVARDYYVEGIDRKSLVSTGFWSILFCSTFFFLGISFSSDFWVGRILGVGGYEIAFILMALSIPTGSLLSYFSILARFDNKPTRYSIGVFLQLTFQIIISIYLVLVVRTGIIGVFIAILVGECIGVLYFGILNRRLLSFKFNRDILRRVLRFSLPTLPAILAGWIDNSLGQVMVGKFISVEELGVYSISLQLISVFTLISTSFNNVWYPFAYESSNRGDFGIQARKLFTIVACSLLFVTLNLSILSRDIVLLLSNSSYINASKYFILLCFPACVYLLTSFVSISVNLTRETKYISYSYGAGSLLNVLLLFLLIPKYGIIVVPACLAVSRVMSYSILYRYSGKATGLTYNNFWIFGIFTVTVFSYLIMEADVNQSIMYLFLIFVDLLFVFWSNREYGWINILQQKVIKLTS